ncbi:hypothetical protein QCA50_020792 [Cerrena zonata]|uniref:Uncharacterized protein n=1 Tax=Cerrena zonata TaxID=2478898 RepID=A0AAW0F8Y1_9APHY
MELGALSDEPNESDDSDDSESDIEPEDEFERENGFIGYGVPSKIKASTADFGMKKFNFRQVQPKKYPSTIRNNV